MAILITVTGTQTFIKIPKKDALKFLQEKVGGYVQEVRIPTYLGHVGMFCNEEGKMLGLEPNPIATKIFNGNNQILDLVVGNVILFKKGEVS